MGFWGDCDCERCGNEAVVPLEAIEGSMPTFSNYKREFDGWPAVVADDGTIYSVRGEQGLLSPELGECIPIWEGAEIEPLRDVLRRRGKTAVCTHCFEPYDLLEIAD